MNRRIMLSLSVLAMTAALAAFLPGCGRAAPSAAPGSGPPSQEESQEENKEEAGLPEDGRAEPERLYVADAARYRGTVTSMVGGLQSDTGLTVTLAAYQGSSDIRDLVFTFDKNTRASFDLSEVAIGDHLEVFYNAEGPGGQLAGGFAALAVNKLPPAERVYFNGTLVSVSGDGDSRRLLLQNLNTPEDAAGDDLYLYQTVFNVNDGTQLYLDPEELVPGAVLNIYHEGVYAMSLPPQGIPLEIRLMVGAG